MTKYARFLWKHNEVDQLVHLVDVLDAAIYEPRPSWGQTDDALLSRLFAPNKTQWLSDAEWFVAVPSGVQNGAFFVGKSGEEMDPLKYINPDDTDGVGQPIPKPEPPLEPELVFEPAEVAEQP